ncbi:MAG: T9SS type A sorting domain-containing protein, partial [Flavisolibacter sp.]
IAVNQVLPLTFMNFRAIKENNEVRLGWTILQDRGLRSLLIEKSVDGKHFTELKEVKNFSEDEKRISGSYNDELKAPVQYYRLELQRKDNVSEYSSIEKAEENLSSKYKLIPNPANDYISLKLPDNLEEKPLKLIVQSSSGKVIKVIPINNSSRLSIYVKDLSNGIYYARLESDQKDLFCASFIKF